MVKPVAVPGCTTIRAVAWVLGEEFGNVSETYDVALGSVMVWYVLGSPEVAKAVLKLAPPLVVHEVWSFLAY